MRVEANDRKRLEQLCRYITRPALSDERVQLNAAGQVVLAFAGRVTMQLDAKIDAAYPKRWIGKVEVLTRDGHRLGARVDEPEGDPGNTLSRAELEDKAQRLAAYRDGASAAEMTRATGLIRALRETPRVGPLLR